MMLCTMPSRMLYVGLISLHIFWTLEAKLNYAVIVPSGIPLQSPQLMCLHIDGAKGETAVHVTLNTNNGAITLLERNLTEESFFSCDPVQVPGSVADDEKVATVSVSITSSGKVEDKVSKVLLKRKRSKILIQTDKAVYKPGQQVKFRVMSLYENLRPCLQPIEVIEVKNPDKNRIGQWLNVSVDQGIAEFSLPLSEEPSLGEYTIKVKDTEHTFSVEEYVLPRFEVSLQFPQVKSNSEEFEIKICGRYTYGKPVQGSYNVTVYQTATSPRRFYQTIAAVNTDIAGKLDKTGCSTTKVKHHFLRLEKSNYQITRRGDVSITEEGTGVQLSAQSQTQVSTTLEKVSFVDADNSYRAGIPYTGKLKLADGRGEPIPDKAIHLSYRNNHVTEQMTLVTDVNGRASFTLENTASWKQNVIIEASSMKEESPSLTNSQYVKAKIELSPFYSKSSSFLKLHSLENVLPCEGQQDVRVDYILKDPSLNPEASHLDLHYLVTAKGLILSFGEVRIPVDGVVGDVKGSTSFTFPHTVDSSPSLKVFVYVFLPRGEIVADLATFKVQKCFQNKVSVGFSRDEVLPGSDVSVQIRADPGSLCALRVVDESVVLMKPEKELTADKVHSLFPFSDSDGYDHAIADSPRCPQPRRYHWRRPIKTDPDVHTLLQNMKIKIITNADINKPCNTHSRNPVYSRRGSKTKSHQISEYLVMVHSVTSADSVASLSENDITEDPQEAQEMERIRTYFPETWLWEMQAVRDSGSVVLQKSSPDTITDWNAGAFCMGPSGFGLSSPASLRVFKPFFVDVTLPYSVVRGESFTLKASVFNYLNDCIKIRTTMEPSEELIEEPCDDCLRSSCLCPDKSMTFNWNLKAMKMGKVNITMQTEALDTEDLCNNERPFVPKQGNIDTIIKPLLVQPGGVLEEKSHSTMLCAQNGDEQPKAEEVSLRVPENILADSERAHFTVLGDLMGTAMQNLDQLLAMPYGCGEQNMGLFAPNIFVLQYLEKTHQLKEETQAKAKRFLETGYQRQLNYKHDDGSYSAFGKADREGNTWLTAFVVKSFNKARPYISIDENHLTHSLNWLKGKQKENGCFQSVGKLFNNAMKGGVEDELSLSAYVTIALLEYGESTQDPMIRNALSCMKKAAPDVSNVFTQAMMAYASSLSGDAETQQSCMEKLDKQAVRKDGKLYWERPSAKPRAEQSSWHCAPSAEVELTSYMLMTSLSGPEMDLGRASEMVNWLSKQQNPNGGFSSTQDTVAALQALAKYAEATYSDAGDVTVTVQSQTGVQKFHVDKTNRLLLQKASLPDIPGDYTLTASGSGCVYVQSVLRYNVPPPRSDAAFAVRVEVKPDQCPEESAKKLQLNIYTEYTGSRVESNMVIVEVKLLSGFIPVKSSVKELEKKKVIQRSEISMDMVTLYLNELKHKSLHLPIMVEQDIKVKNLKPATVKVYDYYETGEYGIGEYNSPCSPEKETKN